MLLTNASALEEVYVNKHAIVIFFVTADFLDSLLYIDNRYTIVTQDSRKGFANNNGTKKYFPCLF